jgi:hypothetical protein
MMTWRRVSSSLSVIPKGSATLIESFVYFFNVIRWLSNALTSSGMSVTIIDAEGDYGVVIVSGANPRLSEHCPSSAA